MFYIVYHRNLISKRCVHVYSSEKSLNDDWLNEFKKHCAINNVAPFELGAHYKLTPLSEDEVSIEPLEVKSFSHWQIVTCNTINELFNLLKKILPQPHT